MNKEQNTENKNLTANFGNTMLCTGRGSKEGSGLDTKIEWKSVKIWKPNLIQKLLIKLRIIKDPRCNVKKINNYLLDEAVMWQDPNRNSNGHWKAVK